VEILLWLVPPAVVTVVAMVWVGWVGREGRGAVDREVAVRRLGQALEKQPRAPRYAADNPARDRSTGIAVRPSRAAPLRAVPPPADEPPQRRVS
jgi:hypothetical protein